jgi:hypothetical protein
MDVVNLLKEKLPDDAMLMRYVDLHSFLYFITQGKLRFARLDTFEDLNEGFPVRDGNAWPIAGDPERVKNIVDKDEMVKEIGKLKEHRQQVARQYYHQRNLFACCWYMGEKESMAMWNLYSNRDSVAIRFKANQLISLISSIAGKDTGEFSRMQFGTVDYTDLSSIKHPADHHCTGFLKDDSFRHEQEFRFLAEADTGDDIFEFELGIGELKNIDFAILSHPKMEEWKIRNILNVLSCYDLSDKFQPSSLSLKNNF